MKMKTYFFTALMLSVSMMTSAQKKLVALSFDDGPNTGTTVRMLDVLKKHDVKASFFVIGKNINEESAKVMMRAHNEGHDIENHSLTHASMPSLSADSVKREVEITTALIEKYTGEKPQFFRPPYIAVSNSDPIADEITENAANRNTIQDCPACILFALVYCFLCSSKQSSRYGSFCLTKILLAVFWEAASKDFTPFLYCLFIILCLFFLPCFTCFFVICLCLTL